MTALNAIDEPHLFVCIFQKFYRTFSKSNCMAKKWNAGWDVWGRILQKKKNAVKTKLVKHLAGQQWTYVKFKRQPTVAYLLRLYPGTSSVCKPAWKNTPT